VLSYSRACYLQEVLASVTSQAYPRLEVIVVNNRGPGSEQAARITRQFPSVRLIQNPDNLGFTGGMNVGIEASSGSYVYLTEDDVVLRPGCIAALVSYMEEHPAAGLAAPVMYNRASGTIRSAGGRFELASVFRMTIIGEGEPGTHRFPGAFDVMYIPGASIFARLGTLQGMHGFRPDYFMYQEDLELCIRVLKSGKRIVTVPEAGVDHFEPPSHPSTDFIEFLRLRNFFATYLLHAPMSVLPAFLVRYGPMAVARALASDPRLARLTIKAWSSVLARAPRLLWERDGRVLS
jgi:GT2 family glycosyltransferase